jgi:hypothetical protein
MIANEGKMICKILNFSFEFLVVAWLIRADAGSWHDTTLATHRP